MAGRDRSPVKISNPRRNEQHFRNTGAGEGGTSMRNSMYGSSYYYRGKEMWHIIDATGLETEALAEQLVPILQGRHRPDWKREQWMGDQVVVINCRNVAMDDNEGTPLPWRMRAYSYATGYPKSWGIVIRRADEEYMEDPCRPLWQAVWEKLPQTHPVNRSRPHGWVGRRFWIEKLHCFADNEHPFKDKELLPKSFPIETVGSEQYHALRSGVQAIPRRKKPQGWKA